VNPGTGKPAAARTAMPHQDGTHYERMSCFCLWSEKTRTPAKLAGGTAEGPAALPTREQPVDLIAGERSLPGLTEPGGDKLGDVLDRPYCRLNVLMRWWRQMLDLFHLLVLGR
jgi:hypothetical protein